jgi:hypothetical protein
LIQNLLDKILVGHSKILLCLWFVSSLRWIRFKLTAWLFVLIEVRLTSKRRLGLTLLLHVVFVSVSVLIIVDYFI